MFRDFSIEDDGQFNAKLAIIGPLDHWGHQNHVFCSEFLTVINTSDHIACKLDASHNHLYTLHTCVRLLQASARA
ncbi:unnamed protein product [Macrosiphum euphorbiae]|uniref:Uncharacterized protein n=1 Tax=Macrosiphum euphorbiae TaxID=13131 RepID=A0AAV0W8S6_9HEMI|nr:unnamed protein product [Macrosiphum euphorbiae]